jgi:hypothetical protein
VCVRTSTLHPNTIPHHQQTEQKYNSRAAEQYRAHLAKIVADQMAQQAAAGGAHEEVSRVQF